MVAMEESRGMVKMSIAKVMNDLIQYMKEHMAEFAAASALRTGDGYAAAQIMLNERK